MGNVVIVAYRPKKGCADQLLELAKDHAPYLRRLGLVTERPAQILRAQNGVLIEVFEWKNGAMAQAHENSDVQSLWEKYALVCDYVPLNKLPEAGDLFAQFQPIAQS
ncbi:MAG: hypothetical protein JKY83_03380 [Rhizobiaceae bacterium]|nr:hypothetical protein [Rhizobiaceae bacterium]